MTTHTLRNLITALEWHTGTEGTSILYKRHDRPNKELVWLVQPIELIQGLEAMASIDGYTLAPLMVTAKGVTYTYENFIRGLRISQWEALNLAVRHEMEMEESKTMGMLEIDEALKALQDR